MASFLDSTVTAQFTGLLYRHFETFSDYRNLVIHKEPLKTITNYGNSAFPGYENETSPENITYTPVSGVYPAIVVFNDKSTDQALTELNTAIPDNTIRVKVKEDARNFISNGKNELFEIDGLHFNEVMNERVQNYLGLKFYIYTLKRSD